MPYLYNLAGAGGLELLGTSDFTTPVVTIGQLGTGNGISIQSVTGGFGIDAVAGTSTSATGRFRSAASAGNSLVVGKTVAASPTVAAVQFSALSAASAPVFEFTASGGFVSITSVVLTTVSNMRGAVRCKVGDVYYWIPLIVDAGIVGAGAF